MSMIRIHSTLSIPMREVRLTFTTSGGPGGQNVNKLATRAELAFDLDRSASLDSVQREKIRLRLASRVTRDGILKLTCSRHRTQEANRKEALEHFRRLLADALRPVRIRRKTRPTRASTEKRLDAKRARSAIKRIRRSTPD